MTTILPQRPRLRRGLAASPAGPQQYALYDQNRLIPGIVELSPAQIACAQLFSGQHTLTELATLAQKQGLPVTSTDIEALVTLLHEGLFLDSDRFKNYVLGRDRFPSCIGCYPDDPEKIRTQLAGLFTAADGPGMPSTELVPGPGRLRAALLPHMDYARGGVTYGHGFKALVEQTSASLFVIVATSHYSPHRFTLTRKNYSTPLGTVPTDQAYVDRLEQLYGPGLFDDPFAHLPEHSIELEVLLLQYLLQDRRPFRIVPLLVGSFHDCVKGRTEPGQAADIARMVSALREAEQQAGEEVCYVISGDLAHIGPKFGDPDPVGPTFRTGSQAQDDKILAELGSADPDRYFRVIAGESDRRRICGLPPTWLTLAVTKPRQGTVLHYTQYNHPAGQESVSFAAAAFYE